MANWTTRRLPTFGIRYDASSIAATDPTGAPSSAMPSVPSVSPRCRMTCGIGAVREANNSPCATNTAVTAMRGDRLAAGRARCAVTSARLDTPNLHRGGLELRQRLPPGGRGGAHDVDGREVP